MKTKPASEKQSVGYYVRFNPRHAKELKRLAKGSKMSEMLHDAILSQFGIL